MSALLTYEFTIAGTDRVVRAMDTIEARARRLNQAVLRSSLQASSANPRVVSTNTAQVQRQTKALGDAARLEKERLHWIDQRAKYEQRERASAERATRDEERRIARVQSRETERWRRAAVASESQRVREQNAEERMTRMRQRHAAQERRVTIGRNVDRAASVGRAGLGAATAVGRAAIGLASIGGGFALAGALSGELEKNRLATKLAAQAGKTESKGAILREANEVEGFTAPEALAALERWVTLTGELDKGREHLKSWGSLALATSSEIGDLAAASGEAYNLLALSIDDPTKRLQALDRVMKAAAGMGAVGAVEIKDLATRLGELGSSAARFGGDMEKSMKLSVALAQVSKQAGGGSVDEVVTAVQRLPDDLIQNSKKIQARFGVDVWQKGKKGLKLKSQEDILTELAVASGGRFDLLQGILDIRPMKAFMGLGSAYSEAYAKTAGTTKEKKEAGKKAVQEKLGFFMGQELQDTEIKRRQAFVMEDPSYQLKEKFKKFNQQLGEALLPTFMKLIPELEKLAPTLVTAVKALAVFAEWFAKNPLLGLGGVVFAAVAKDIAGAAIGSGIKALLIEILASTAAGKAGAAVATGAAGSLAGAAGTGAAATTGAVAARTGLLGKLGAAGGAGAAATGAAATAALAGTAAAIWQASELSKDVGGKFSALDVLPGFESGEFTFAGLGKDMFTGTMPRKLARLGADIITEDKRRDVEAKRQYEARAAMSGGKPAAPGTQPGTEAGAPAGTSPQGVPVAQGAPGAGSQPVQVPALDTAKLDKSMSDAGRIFGQAAAAEIQRSQNQPNRGNAPSPVKG